MQLLLYFSVQIHRFSSDNESKFETHRQRGVRFRTWYLEKPQGAQQKNLKLGAALARHAELSAAHHEPGHLHLVLQILQKSKHRSNERTYRCISPGKTKKPCFVFLHTVYGVLT